jgi:hypothetical protein
MLTRDKLPLGSISVGIQEGHMHGQRWSSTCAQTSKTLRKLLHALHVKVFPFSQMSVRRPYSELLVMGGHSGVNQPVVQNLLRGFNIRKD